MIIEIWIGMKGRGTVDIDDSYGFDNSFTFFTIPMKTIKNDLCIVSINKAKLKCKKETIFLYIIKNLSHTMLS
jgi:hypothetical protein